MQFLITMFVLLTTLTAQAMPINYFQIIGSHNSYKKMLHSDIKHKLIKEQPNFIKKIDYGHQRIINQLNSGVRHLEIDVVKDPNGGLYSQPWANKLVNTPLFNKQEMEQLHTAGFKVLHQPGIDVQSHCVLFNQCLNTLKTWSDANPEHFVVVVMLNVKENRPKHIPGHEVLKFTKPDYVRLDKTIYDTLQQRLFTPDDLRQKNHSLNQSVMKFGWPKEKALRGKFLFLFDGNKQQNTIYKHQRPSLINASMFANYPAGEPESAFMIINNPIDKFKKIQSLVSQGYMVRTRADANLGTNNDNRKLQFLAARNSGAQIISTDFIPESPQHKQFNYVVQFAPNSLTTKNSFLTH